jgi:hypothetical protein
MRCRAESPDLSALLDGELSGSEERTLRQHVKGCPECRRELTRLRSVSRTLKAWDLAERREPPAGFAERVLAARRSLDSRARKTPAASPRGRRLALPLLPLAAAASLLLLLGLSAALLTGAATAPAPGGAASPDAIAAYRGLAAEGASHLELARFCRENGLDDLAVVEYGRALAADPGLPEARKALAELLPGRGEGFGGLAVATGGDLDTGGALPPWRGPLTGDDLKRALGLSREADGRWLTPEAWARRRAFLEQEDMLALDAERKLQEIARRTVPTKSVPANVVATTLVSLATAEPATFERLKLYPLLDGGRDADVAVFSLAKGMESGVVEIREGSNGPVVVNHDRTRYLYIAAGETIAGGRQNRMIRRPTLVPPNTRSRLPVLCCESSRSTGGERFVASPGIAPPGIRALLLGTANQSEVWAAISAHLADLGASNRTNDLSRAFDHGAGAGKTNEYLRKLLPALSDDRTVGFLAFSRDRFVGGEVFASHSMLEALAPRFIASYVLDAYARADHGRAVSPRETENLLSSVRDAVFYRTRGAETGQEFEFDGGAKGISGVALVPVAGARPLHITLFPSRAARGGGASPARSTRTSGATDDPDDGADDRPSGSGDDRGELDRRREKRGQGIDGGDLKRPEGGIPNLPTPPGGQRPNPPAGGGTGTTPPRNQPTPPSGPKRPDDLQPPRR